MYRLPGYLWYFICEEIYPFSTFFSYPVERIDAACSGMIWICDKEVSRNREEGNLFIFCVEWCQHDWVCEISSFMSFPSYSSNEDIRHTFIYWFCRKERKCNRFKNRSSRASKTDIAHSLNSHIYEKNPCQNHEKPSDDISESLFDYGIFFVRFFKLLWSDCFEFLCFKLCHCLIIEKIPYFSKENREFLAIFLTISLFNETFVYFLSKTLLYFCLTGAKKILSLKRSLLSFTACTFVSYSSTFWGNSLYFFSPSIEKNGDRCNTRSRWTCEYAHFFSRKMRWMYRFWSW